MIGRALDAGGVTAFHDSDMSGYGFFAGIGVGLTLLAMRAADAASRGSEDT